MPQFSTMHDRKQLNGGNEQHLSYDLSVCERHPLLNARLVRTQNQEMKYCRRKCPGRVYLPKKNSPSSGM